VSIGSGPTKCQSLTDPDPDPDPDGAMVNLARRSFEIPHHRQHARVFLVPGVIDGALDLEKAVEIDPVGGSISIGRRDPTAPGAIEVEVDDAAKNVDPVWGAAQLENLVRIVGIDQARAAELGEGSVDVGDVVRRSVDPEVDILGVAGLRVEDECQTADDQVPDVELGEQSQDVFEVGDGVQRSIPVPSA